MNIFGGGAAMGGGQPRPGIAQQRQQFAAMQPAASGPFGISLQPQQARPPMDQGAAKARLMALFNGGQFGSGQPQRPQTQQMQPQSDPRSMIANLLMRGR